MKRSIICVAVLASMLGACATNKVDGDNLIGSGPIIASKVGSDGTTLSNDSLESIDLTALYGSYGFADPKVTAAGISNKDNEAKDKYLRNDMQDKLLAASNQRCAAYIRMLVASKSNAEFTWSGIATLLSGASSVVTPVSIKNALGAGATVMNGESALYDKSYFNSLAIDTVTSGIVKQREGILQQITQERDGDLSKYPVNRAVADALLYHAACNVVTGLQTAAGAVKSVDTTAPTAPAQKPAAPGAPATPQPPAQEAKSVLHPNFLIQAIK